MKLVLTVIVSALTACSGGGSSSTDTTTAAATTATPSPTPAPSPTPSPNPTPSPAPNPSPAPTPAPAPAPSPAASQGRLGYQAWGQFRCAGCHGGNFPGASNPSLIMSSMQTVQKHKDAYGTTAISGWGLTVTQEDANNMAVFAANPSAYY
jgi:mono/diheme cytochrome c family protein